ncbi:MAG: ornithine--oxo-acid transaminase [Bryobacterales bacterium]|nr:ornithine--oxo-acid transaminase [Bryobacterales bacterium]
MLDTSRTGEMLALEDRWGTHNYHPLPVVVAHAQGPWVFDIEGRRYLDCLSAYSAVNQGHCHPRILKALREQAERVTLTSRAYRNDQLPLFCQELAQLCGMDIVLPMNTGAEAVETAIKAARRWGYMRKGIAPGRAEIVVCENNFHGRTTTIVGFSSDPESREGFGPFTPGFRLIPFGDAAALEAAITPDTCAFLVEPIQCEAGILMPPEGYLAEVAAICKERGVLLIVDEIQTALGRTGKLFACDHEGVKPDAYLLGKALSGGCYPVSAVVARRAVLEVFDPGSHGSTYGGNPLGCAVAREALQVTLDEDLIGRSAELGKWFLQELELVSHPDIVEVRGVGLLAGIELRGPARPYCERLQHLGMLCKETHDRVIRIAPPLVVERDDLEWALEQVRTVFADS